MSKFQFDLRKLLDSIYLVALDAVNNHGNPIEKTINVKTKSGKPLAVGFDKRGFMRVQIGEKPSKAWLRLLSYAAENDYRDLGEHHVRVRMSVDGYEFSPTQKDLQENVGDKVFKDLIPTLNGYLEDVRAISFGQTVIEQYDQIPEMTEKGFKILLKENANLREYLDELSEDNASYKKRITELLEELKQAKAAKTTESTPAEISTTR